MLVYAFSALFESVKQFFYFLSISDFFVGTAVDTAAFKSCKKVPVSNFGFL
jgi:hypothetical protein